MIETMLNTVGDPNFVLQSGTLTAEFQRLTGHDWPVPHDLQSALETILMNLGSQAVRCPDERKRELYAAINSKLRLTQSAYQQVLDTAAAHKVSFHYHDKIGLQQTLDYGDRVGFFKILLRSRVPPKALSKLADCFRFPTWDETRSAFLAAMREDEKALLIQRSIFSAYAFACFQTEKIHQHFSRNNPATYYPRFYDHLRHLLPNLFDRPIGLGYLKINDEWLGGSTDKKQIRAKLAREIRELSRRLSNHCYLGILVKPLTAGESVRWRLYSDLILYAEKGQADELKTGYFHPEKVAAQTKAYIAGLNAEVCRFEIAQQGLFYKDCFVINYPQSAKNAQTEPDLLVLFEKNERDETPIPCPACRSWEVRGNSYPVLGVRSWECNNLLCPERSKYDRGNRYSASSLIRQEAIEEDDAVIPLSSLRLWKRDVVSLNSETDILPMLVRHYSLLGDRVLALNTPASDTLLLGRQVIGERWDWNGTNTQDNSLSENDPSEELFEGPYFRRICVERSSPHSASFPNLSGLKGVEVYCGDCFETLTQLSDATVDGIVTSPPYYNAREYAQWPNIYCFLYDQYNAARELHRVLKPDGIFLYNIFDYFDNENNIVFSAMGKKRIILGAYAINLFERLGFEVIKNVIWDKGEIEGKRNFNQGNRSPYYQAPFNCWEHILVFRKAGSAVSAQTLPFILRAQPVVKMIGGRNTLGHTAPYPEAIPQLLMNLLEPRSTVLDPFSGSMTTARVAYKSGMRSISIDYKEEYCRLGLTLLMENDINLLNFDE